MTPKKYLHALTLTSLTLASASAVGCNGDPSAVNDDLTVDDGLAGDGTIGGGLAGDDTVDDDLADNDDAAAEAAAREFFLSLDEPQTPAATASLKEVECQNDCPQNGPTPDGKYECSYKHWENVEAFDSYAVFQPDLDRLYPGAIFKGSTYLENGYLEEIVFPEGTRTEIEASFSLENTTESPTISMSSPSLASYREERNRVLSGQHGTNPTTVQLSMQQIHSEAHFNVAAGAAIALGAGGGVGGIGGMFAAAFERKKETKQNMFMLRLRQQNYQVNLTAKPRPEDYFGQRLLLDDTDQDADSGLSEYIDDGVMPVIVSDLFYGRLVVCAVTTHASEQAARDAWMAAVAGGLIGQGVGVAGAAAAALTHGQRQILSESRVDCFVNGGAGSDAVKAVQGVDGIVEAVLGSGDQSAKTPGGLIGYRLTTLTNRELPISLTTNYTSEECLKTSGHLTTELNRIQLHGLGGVGDQELYGKVGITYPEPGQELTGCSASGGTGGKTVMLFERGRDQHIKVKNNFVVGIGTQSTGDVNIKAGSKICVFGSLWDKSIFGFIKDDSLGEASAWVDVKQWNGEFGLNMKNAVAHFRFDLSL
jgi:hypothetical protein